jgi:hypothetical protein
MKTKDNNFCNRCSYSCESIHGGSYGLINAQVSAGYGSTHLIDGDVHEFSLCERCLFEIFKEFKLTTKIGNYLDRDLNHSFPDFDRRAYQAEGVRLFPDDFTQEELQQYIDEVKNKKRDYDWLNNYTREELIVSLYDAENDDTKERLPEYVEALKRIVAEKTKKLKDLGEI